MLSKACSLVTFQQAQNLVKKPCMLGAKGSRVAQMPCPGLCTSLGFPSCWPGKEECCMEHRGTGRG